jgi:hypothetical protein
MRRLAAISIPVLGWVVTLAYAYPGIVTWDGVQLLAEARSGVYADDHPPAYIAIWHLVDKIVPGEAGMLVLQTGLFLVGLVALFRRWMSPLGASIAATLVLVFPPTMVPMAAIWKDSLMAGLLVAGSAAVFADDRRWRGVGAVALCLATAVRYNAAAATFPLIAMVVWVPGWRGVRRYAAAAGVWIAITAIALVANSALTDKRMYAWQSLVAPSDIVGIIAHVDEPLSDSDLLRALDGTELRVTHDIQGAARALYSPRDGQRAIGEDDLAFWHVPFYDPMPPARREAFTRAWWQLVGAHPLAYVEHRVATMGAVLERSNSAVTWRGHGKEAWLRAQLGLRTDWPHAQLAATRALQRFEHAIPVFTPWLYLVVALVLVPFVRRVRDVSALLASGIMYEGSLLVLATSPDYRYSHWMIVATAVCVVAVVVQRARAARRT